MTPSLALETIARIISGRFVVPATLFAGEQVALIVDTAVAHGLGPMLLWALKEQGIDTTDAMWSSLRESSRQTTVQHMLAASAQEQVDAALVAADIPVIWLKGADLAHTVYPKPSLRPLGDLDLLVPYAQRQAALAVVAARGYHLEDVDLFHGAHDMIHHYHLRGGASDAMRLELHFRLFGYSDRLLSIEQIGWFWQHTRPWTEKGTTYTFLTPEANLLYLSAHAVLLHGEADFRLLRYFDLHRLITQSQDVDWQLVTAQAVVFGWTYALERALRLAQRYFSTPLPQGLIEDLQQQRPDHENIAIAASRQERGTRWQAILAQFAAMSTPARLRLAWRLALPPAAYMRWRYNLDAGWKLPFAYVYRWADVIGEIGRTVTRGGKIGSKD